MSEGQGYRVNEELEDKPKGLGIIAWVLRHPDPEKRDLLYLSHLIHNIDGEENMVALTEIDQEDLDRLKTLEYSITPHWTRWIVYKNLKTNEVRITYKSPCNDKAIANLMVNQIPILAPDRYIDGSHVPIIREKTESED